MCHYIPVGLFPLSRSHVSSFPYLSSKCSTFPYLAPNLLFSVSLPLSPTSPLHTFPPSDKSSELNEALKRSQLELANTLSELNTLGTTYNTVQVQCVCTSAHPQVYPFHCHTSSFLSVCHIFLYEVYSTVCGLPLALCSIQTSIQTLSLQRKTKSPRR